MLTKLKKGRVIATFLIVAVLAGCDSPASKPRAFDFIIDWQAEPTYMGVYYAKSLGLFKDLGLDVKIIQSWGAHDAVAAVASGKYMMGTASGGATVIGSSAGAKVISTAVIYQELPTTVFGLKKTGVGVPKDLEGKRVGIYAKSITRNEFEAFMKINGVDDKKVNIVTISGADLPFLLGGQVDAVLNYFELSPTQLALEHESFSLMLSKYGVKSYGLNIIASPEAIKKEPEVVKKFTQAILDGYKRGCADQPAAVNAFLTEFPEKDKRYVTSSWQKVCAFLGGRYGDQNAEGWQRTIDLYRDLGLLTGPVGSKDVMANF